MGAFYVLRRGRRNKGEANLLRSLDRCFTAQGFRDPEIIDNSEWHFRIYKKINCDNENLLLIDDNNFAFSTGTFIYRNRIQKPALKSFFCDFRENSVKLDGLYGHYCAGVCIDGKLQFFVDGNGIYKVYRDSSAQYFSSSFLAVLESVGPRHIESQATYEYIFQGATYGDNTVIKEIKTLAPGRCVDVTGSHRLREMGPTLQPGFIEKDRQIHLIRNLRNLRNYHGVIADLFGDRIDCALSGGYDTRLILALLQEQGVHPRLHVYGDRKDQDVRIAQLIANGEGVVVNHIDKSLYPRVEPDEFRNIVERNFYAFDGYPTDGIFDNASDLQTRLDRCRNGELMLNGGGGEAFRNFFYLLDRHFSVKQLLWTFYSRFDPGVCTPVFSESRYLGQLANKIKNALGRDDDRLERCDIEFLYPAFRCRFWMGRNTSLNNRLGWALTPFADNNIVKDAIRIPLRYKNFGRFEAELIKAVSPSLASYPSAYGHNFAGGPPFGRVLKDLTTLLRPAFVRKYLYRIRVRPKRRMPYYLTGKYIARAIDPSFPYMSRFLHVGKVRDVEHYNRICTLEHLFERYQPKPEDAS